MSRPAKIIKLMKGVKPTRMWIDGKSFYITKHDEKDSFNQRVHNCTEEYKSHYNISFSNDLYYTRFQLPGVYYEKLHKFPHFTIKELEEYTNTNINIPETNEEDSIVISSKDVENLMTVSELNLKALRVCRKSDAPVMGKACILHIVLYYKFSGSILCNHILQFSIVVLNTLRINPIFRIHLIVSVLVTT
ncbi:hypothetical protein Trydic_g22844 [Trypoxylus dichotomus]